MDITTQQFLMGAGGGSTQKYWITSISYSQTVYPKGGNVGLDFTSAGDMVIASGYSPRANLFKMNEAGTVLWSKSLAQNNDSYEYYPKDKFCRVMVLANGNIMQYGETYNTNTSQRQSGIAVYDNSGNLQYQRELYSNSFGFTLQNAIQFSNGNIVYGGTGTACFIEMDSSGYASNVVARQEYRIYTGASAFNSPNYGIGKWMQTDGTYLYGLGQVAYYNSGTDSYDKYICILTTNNSLASVGSYYYRVSGYYQSYGIYPLDFARASAGTYFIHSTNGMRYTLLLTYTTSSGVQWTRAIETSKDQTGGGTSESMVCVDAQNNCYVVYYSNPELTAITIIKYDTTGSIIWKRNLTGLNASFVMGRAVVYRDALYLLVGGVVAKLSLAGTGTGTYGSYTYATSSQTDAAGPTVTQFDGSTFSYASGYTLLNANVNWSTPTITVTTTNYPM